MKDPNNTPEAKKAIKLLQVHINLISDFSVSFVASVLAFLKNWIQKDAENELKLCSKISRLLKDLTISSSFSYKFENLSEVFFEFLDLTDSIGHEHFVEFIITLIK